MGLQEITGHVLGPNVRHRLHPTQLHAQLELVLQDLEIGLHAFCAVGPQGPDGRPSESDAVGSKSNSLENVGSSSDTAVHQHLDAQVAFAQFRHDLSQQFQPRSSEIQLPATVIGQDDAVQPSVRSHDCILPSLHTLQHNLHLGHRSEPLHVIPCQGAVHKALEGHNNTGGRSLRPALLVDWRHLNLVPAIPLTLPEHRRVHSDQQSLRPNGLRPTDHI
mmetsp:Transcript_49282/g.111741  ORF Transcript_49282/g.111741 Transcript_49282/m.111741 type:complete len:219 (-) Transcript_49282:656-1312(-)